VYCVRCAIGRAPTVQALKHNQLFGAFWARFLVWVLGPFERVMRGRVRPNTITAISLLLCAATGLMVGLGDIASGVWLYAFAGILDVLDGRLARSLGRPSAQGALFDSVSDRWGELLVFGGYAWYLHDSPWLLAVMVASGASMMVSYTRARAEGLGLQMSGGIMQRAERIVLVALGTLIAAWYGIAGSTHVSAILGVTMLICGGASIATAINRWYVAYMALVRREEASLAEAEQLAARVVQGGHPQGSGGQAAQQPAARSSTTGRTAPVTSATSVTGQSFVLPRS
jgi:CDP-diacylglycerol--glycerol-3-phosphate 3-phosphatidyltransferase